MFRSEASMFYYDADHRVSGSLIGKPDKPKLAPSMRMSEIPTGKEISKTYDKSALNFLIHRRDPEDKYNLLAWPSISVIINGGLDGGVVADLGCGPGEVTKRFSQLKGKPSFIYGFDASKEMIEIANVFSKDSNISYDVANIEKIPLSDESVDLALASYSLLHVVKLQDALQEIQRILKPGGRVVILEPHEQRFQHYYEMGGGIGYFQEGWHLEKFPGLEDDNSDPIYVPTYYRSTRNWIKEISKSGLEFIDFHEPKPSDLMIERNHPIWQEYQKCLRMIVFEARKN